MAKQSHGWTKVLTNLLLVIPSIFNIVSHFVHSLERDLRQAKRSVIVLFVLALFALTLMMGVWFTLCAMIFLWLLGQWGIFPSLTIMLLSHIVLLLVVGIWMAKAKNKLLFSNTRELFRS